MPRPVRVLLTALTATATIFFLFSCGGGSSDSYTPDPITLVSVDSAGIVGSGDSILPAVSGDGSYVVFQSNASGLVASDQNSSSDVFLRDTVTGLTSRVSVSTMGTEGGAYSGDADISADGRYVVFASSADNLVPGDNNLDADAFRHDTQTAITERVSVSTAGTEGNSGSFIPTVSADGRYVAFYSFATNLHAAASSYILNAYVRDTQLPLTTHVSISSAGTPANGVGVFEPVISSDGSAVVYYGGSDNLVPNDNNNSFDVFYHDLGTSITSRLSVSTAGSEGNAGSSSDSADLNADGRYVVFASTANNLVPDDTNNVYDIFLRDTVDQITSRVSVSTAGSEGNNGSYTPAISGDGRYVVFSSYATNFTSEYTGYNLHIYVHDTQTATTTLLSRSADGAIGNGDSRNPDISADGHTVVFQSDATNLVAGTVPASTVQVYRTGVP